jgi:hypothetical protein
VLGGAPLASGESVGAVLQPGERDQIGEILNRRTDPCARLGESLILRSSQLAVGARIFQSARYLAAGGVREPDAGSAGLIGVSQGRTSGTGSHGGRF